MLNSQTNDIVLSMIVKNEEAVLARCLESVRPLLSAWVIVDTGSTDRTREIAYDLLAEIPGEVISRPWKNFGHNRTEALELSRSRGEYSLVIDADDTLDIAPDRQLPRLTLDAHSLRIRYGTTSYDRVQLLRNGRNWRYEGVVHEYPACDGPFTQGRLEGIEYVIGRDGARAQDPDRFLRDAELIQAALEVDPTNQRYVFYLAQSYRDAGVLQPALMAYEHRTTMGGWDEEVFYARLEAAKLRERLGQPFETVQSAYLAAYESRPSRAEPLYELSRYCRAQRHFALGCVYASSACEISRPDDRLFVAESVYRWQAIDELAVSAYHAGRFALARVCNEQLLSSAVLPESELPRIRGNLQWCERAMATDQK